MSRYTSVTEADLRSMLDEIGVGSVDELFRDIPAALRLDEPLKLDEGRAEQEVYDELRALARANVSTEDELCFRPQ